MISPHISHAHHHELLSLLSPRKVVIISFVNRPLSDTNMIMEDTFNGVTLMLEKLLPYCTKPASFGSNIGRGYTGRRLGWEYALKLNNYDPSKVPFFEVGERDDEIAEKSREILSLPPEERPDFIFCYNDLRAMIFRQVMREMNIPEHEILLAGYDGHPKAIEQGINTVRLDGKQKGRLGLYMLQNLLEGNLEEPAYHSICGKVEIAEKYLQKYIAEKN